MMNLTPAMRDVCLERQRQVSDEGWTPDHDDSHCLGDLAIAGVCYALIAAKQITGQHPTWAQKYMEQARSLWPWDKEWWKPQNPRRDLVRAGALIMAEIERLDRLDAATESKVREGE